MAAIEQMWNALVCADRSSVFIRKVADLIADLNDIVEGHRPSPRAAVPKDVPEQIVRSIAEGTTRRLASLASHSGDD
jgi:hypothetical protein